MTPKNSVKNTFILVLLALTLTSCGFHLRGNIPLPEGIQNIFVLGPQGSFKDQLETVLERGGATIVPGRGGADVVLNLTRVEPSRTVGTLNERGKVDSFNILFDVAYVLETPDGVILREAELDELRRYDFDPELVVESESEEQELIEDMEQELALQIVRQLSTITNYPPVSGAVAPKPAGINPEPEEVKPEPKK